MSEILNNDESKQNHDSKESTSGKINRKKFYENGAYYLEDRIELAQVILKCKKEYDKVATTPQLVKVITE